MIKYFQKVSFYSNRLNEKWNGKCLCCFTARMTKTTWGKYRHDWWRGKKRKNNGL